MADDAVYAEWQNRWFIDAVEKHNYTEKLSFYFVVYFSLTLKNYLNL